jgi:hypothetical protein
MQDLNIKIDNQLQRKIFWFDLEKNIRKLLGVIPKEHLIGLKRITIVDNIKDRKLNRLAGVYTPQTKSHPAAIELSVESIYKGMPKIFFLLPFVAKFSLADALFHEIGHHYHHNYKHKIDKANKEKFAESYRAEMLKKAFWLWALILRPISPLIRYLARVAGR